MPVCSNAIDESPISDIKMDISETTTSQESPITSPDFENERNLSADVRQQHHDGAQQTTNDYGAGGETTSTTAMASSSTTTTDEHVISSMLADQCDLHNRNSDIDCEDNFLNRSVSNVMSRSNCQLTLVDSHPLMSPLTSANSDSDPIEFGFQEVMAPNAPLRPDSPIVTKSPTNVQKKTHADSAKAEALPSNDNGSDDESEPSQYEASVEPSFKSVSLMATASGSKLRSDDSPPNDGRRKIPLGAGIRTGDGDDDVSSIDTVSNDSIDDDRLDEDFDDYPGDNNLVSASVSSSLLDDAAANEAAGGAAGGSSLLPQYSATDEARDSRGWQRITLSNGKTRDIDMKVIDPYKRVLSHGGYLRSGGHNAIIVFSACHLPDRSRADYNYVMDNLFLYVVKTLEQLVTEDYVFVYLHGGSTRTTSPSFAWLKQCYQLLDYRLRKSLKNLYMVHPTLWLKSIVWMARPFLR